MPKIIDYTLPVEFLSGNISGRQELTYAQGGEAYNAPNGVVTSAENYQPRLIACRRWKKNRNYFCVRTKTSVNMSAKYRSSLAVMGGAGAIYTALTHMKESTIYAQCVAATPKGMTLRAFLIPIIINALAAKDADIVIADGVTIVNPWISSASPNVPVTTYNYNKFIDVLGSAELNEETIQAILDVFGDVDGEKVIVATNDFLSGLGSHKAVMLAGYINEDPMLVCSLGLQPMGVTMPVRWICSLNGETNFFDLGIKGNLDTTVELMIKPVTASTNNVIACFGDSTTLLSAITIYTPTTGGTRRNTRFGNKYFSNSATQSVGNILTIKANKNNFSINDVVVGSFGTTAAFETSETLTLFKTNGAESLYYDNEMMISYLILGGNDLRRFVPFRKKSGDTYTCELLDIEFGNLATRVGSFTIPDIVYPH